MFGEAEEGAKDLEREVFSRRPLQHEADDKEASVLDHVLLHS